MLREFFFAAALAGVGLCSPLAAQEPFPRDIATERKIKAALGEIVELDIDQLPLADLAELLKTRRQIEVLLDHQNLADEGIASDTPFTFHLRGVSLNSALRLLLSEADLTHVVHDEVLLITTKTTAENLITSRLYQVADLVEPDGDFVARSRPSGILGGSRKSADYNTLAETLNFMAAPTMWECSGPACDVYECGDGLISIPQAQEVHEEIQELLVSLRAVREVQRKAGRALREQPVEQPPVNEREFKCEVFPLFPAGGVFYRRDEAAQREAAAEFAKLIQDLIAPQSWQLRGGSGAVAVAGSNLLVRQTPQKLCAIAELIAATNGRNLAQPPRLFPAGPRADWPQEAEPTPRGAAAAIEQALRQPVNLDLQEKPLSEIAEYISQEFEIPVVLDHRALSDANLPSDVPLSLEAAGVSLESALRQLLSPVELAFDVRHEALFITTEDEAENLLSLKVYPVFDLAAEPADAAASGARLDYAALEELLLHSIAPTTWHAGAVMAYPNCGALMVRQRRDVHQQIARLFAALRQAAQQ
jgi:hypothetical protein